MGVLRTLSTGAPPSLAGNANGDIYGVNGIDKAFVRDRVNGIRNWGIAAPPAAPTAATIGAGVVDGDVIYRVTWENQNSGNYGLYSADLAFAATTDTVRVTRPSTAGIDAQVTHWILWRTVQGEGTIFYRVASVAIATSTYDDNNADDAISDGETLEEHSPPDPMFRYLREFKGLFFLYGSRVESTGTVTVANGSGAVTGIGTQFNASHVGEKFYFTGDETTYSITAVSAASGAAALTISPVKVGAVTGGTYVIVAERPSDMAVQRGDDESFRAGDRWSVFPNDGDFPSGMDVVGNTLCLYKQHNTYGYEFGADPLPSASAVVYPILHGRGLINEWCSVKDGPYAFNLDRQGIYQFDGAGQSEAIDLAIRRFFRPDAGIAADDRVNWAYASTWRAVLDPMTRTAVWFVTTGSDAVAKTAFCYNLDRQFWTVHRFPQGIRAAAVDSDSNGVLRAWLMDNLAAPASPWAFGGTRQLDGTASGTIAGTATASGATSLTDGAAAFLNTGDKLKGIPVVAFTAPFQMRIITTNTATVLTIDSAWTSNPTVGTKYRVGAVETRWRSNWLLFDPQARQQTQILTVYFEPTSTDIPFFVRFFKDFGTSPIVTWQQAGVKDGVEIPNSALTDGWLMIHANKAGGRVAITLPQNAIRAFSVELMQLDANNPVIVEGFDLDLSPLGKSLRAE